ncbi:hypothetical protein DV704_01390 [Meiothermus sp. QL-1]|uniref:hypothetical protein n=1 Tax=Meiothermus sp. QL-1 TaxID=2058095 RepID=UPI000E0A668C|nr:hypothetical protein [Meiothermus sp. QL-1]RDI96500.1 hypothetical protein DV704_01390 [Meiothermus sp. QL-1]
MESILTTAQPASKLPQYPQRNERPARLIISRPQPRCPVKVIWEGFRMSKAWGDALETYGLEQE